MNAHHQMKIVNIKVLVYFRPSSTSTESLVSTTQKMYSSTRTLLMIVISYRTH